MKKNFLSAVFIIAAILASIAADQYCLAAETKKSAENIGICAFLCNRPVATIDHKKLTHSLKECLSKAADGQAGLNIFIMPEAGKTAVFSSTDAELAAIGKLNGADKLIVPYLYSLDGKFVVSVKIIDCGRSRKEANYFASCPETIVIDEKIELISKKIMLNLKIASSEADIKAKKSGVLVSRPDGAQTMPYELSRWEILKLGPGCELERSAEKLKISFAPNASNDEKHNVFGIFALSRFKIEGDFDIVLDYSLIEWPFQNGTRIGVGVFAEDGFLGKNKWYQQAERISSTWADSNFVPFTGDAYLVDTADDNIKGVMEASGGAGQIRINRTGNIFSAYCRDNGENERWLNIYSSSTKTGPVSLFMGAWNHDYCFKKQKVEAGFGALKISAGGIGDIRKKARNIRK